MSEKRKLTRAEKKQIEAAIAKEKNQDNKKKSAQDSICGTVNRSLDLEETDGWMECEHCGNTVQLMKYVKTRRIPCYQMKDCQVLVPLPQK